MSANSGRQRSSGRRATLKEVAAEVGVSPATVSNAYNRPDQLSSGLRKKVLETARRLGYPGPDPTARSLRRGRSGVIGVLYADRLSYAFEDPAAVLFLRGISEAAEEAGLQLLLVTGLRDDSSVEAVGKAAVDGFVVYSMPEDDPSVDAAIGRRLPTVLVDQPEGTGAPLVGIDDRGAARAAAEHLVSLGHRRLGVVSFELAREPVGGLADAARQAAATFVASGQRLRGYAEALEPAGIPWESIPVYECAENVLEEGKAAAEVLLAPDDRPTAILATSDLLAFGVMEAAARMGLAVPGDLSVVGFDDVPEAARANPPLTTVHQPHMEKGLKAGRLLVSGLRVEGPARTEILPTRLVVRGSTAPPKPDA